MQFKQIIGQWVTSVREWWAGASKTQRALAIFAIAVGCAVAIEVWSRL